VVSFESRKGGAVLENELQYEGLSQTGPNRYEETTPMKPTAKPVKQNRKLESGKKLEKKAPLLVRSLTVKW
jgi:hypothetical protein